MGGGREGRVIKGQVRRREEMKMEDNKGEREKKGWDGVEGDRWRERERWGGRERRREKKEVGEGGVVGAGEKE